MVHTWRHLPLPGQTIGGYELLEASDLQVPHALAFEAQRASQPYLAVVFHPELTDAFPNFRAGLEARRRLRGRNVPQLRDLHFWNEGTPVLFFDPPRGAPIRRLLQRVEEPWPSGRVASLLVALIDLLLHHRVSSRWLQLTDLSTDKIWVDDDDVSFLLLPDLGTRNPRIGLRSRRRSHNMAPETAVEERYDDRSAVYQLGVAAFEMLARCDPFGQSEAIRTLTRISRGEHELLPRLVPEAFQDLIYDAMHLDPQRRPESLARLRDVLLPWREESVAHERHLADIDEAPDDPEPYLVYADRLQQLGHPRGALIVVQERLREPNPTNRRALIDEEAELLAEPRFYGRLSAYRLVTSQTLVFEPSPHFVGAPRRAIDVEWFCGYIRTLRLLMTGEYRVPPLSHLVELPSFRFLRAFTLATADLADADTLLNTTANDLCKLGPAHDLFIGDVHAYYPSLELNGAATLSAKFSGVVRLGLRGHRVGTGALRHPTLRELRLYSGVLEEQSLVDLAEGDLPNLTHFELMAGSAETDARPESLAEWLAAHPHLQSVILGSGSRTWLSVAISEIQQRTALAERLVRLDAVSL